MFGLAPIRTRCDKSENVKPVIPSRPYNETGAESALLRTGSLLEDIEKQHKHISGNTRLKADVRSDELTALTLLRSCLAQLQNCIREHDNPPPIMSKRKALIMVEKARREVLAACRECSGRVTEGQKLFEEVERFIELRPDEPVSPHHVNIKWSRPAPSRPISKRRDQAYGRAFRPGASLMASIVGLTAVAEGRDRDTPTSDVGAPTAAFPPTAATTVAAAGKTQPAGLPRSHDSKGRGPQERAARTMPVDRPAFCTGRVDLIGAPQAPIAALGGAVQPQTQASQPSEMAEAAAGDVVEHMQRMQITQARPAESSDGGDDLRPSLSQDVARPCSSSATTMCNMDSCVSGQNRTQASRQATAGLEAADSTRRSYGSEDNDDEGEDEVNSAEGRRMEMGSPNHRVALLMGRPAQRGTAAGTNTASAAAGAAIRSTAATPPAPAPHSQPGSATAAASNAAAAAVGTTDSSSSAYPPTPPPVRSHTGPSVAPSSAAPTSTAGGAVCCQPTRSARVLEDALCSQESFNGSRTFGGMMEQQPSRSGPGVSADADFWLAEGGASKASAAAVGSAVITAGAAASHTQPHQAPAVAPAVPSRYGNAPNVRPHFASPSAQTRSNQIAGQAPSTTNSRHALPATGSQQSASGLLPSSTRPHQHHHLHQPSPSHHPAHAAAVAAAAAHPYAGNGVSHPYLGNLNHSSSNNNASGAGGGASSAYSLPPSGPSSLRDFPTRPGTAGGAGAGGAAGVGYPSARPQTARYGSQPASGHPSLDSGQFPASARNWDNVSLADTEPLPGGSSSAPGQQNRRDGRRRRAGGLLGVVRSVVGFVGVSVLSGAAVMLGAAAVNTGLDEQEAAQHARQSRNGQRRGQRVGRGGDDLIPQRTLQQLRSPDLLALGRG